jgi:hypothetical protein
MSWIQASQPSMRLSLIIEIHFNFNFGYGLFTKKPDRC